MIMARLCRITLAGLLMIAGSLAIGTGSAHAVTVEQFCVGTETTTYDPPLTLVPQQVTVTVNGLFATCTDPDAFNGSYSNQYTTVKSCVTLFDTGSGEGTLVWGNGSAGTSTVRFNVIVTEALGQSVVTSNGIVMAGRYAGASGQQVVTLATPSLLQCLGTGVAAVAGPTTMTFYQQ